MLDVSKSTFDINMLRERCGGAFENYDVHYAPVVDSTMNLKKWFEERGVAIKSGLCLIAGTQTHGVGQHGKWVSDNRDVKLSIVLNEVSTPQEHALINLIAAFSVLRTVRELSRDFNQSLAGDPDFKIKLLNDVLVQQDSSYGKISGSLAVGKHDPEMKRLLEERDNFAFADGFIVLGIGINLVKGDRPVVDPRFKPVALEELIDTAVPREKAIGTLLRNISAFRALLLKNPGMIMNVIKDELIGGRGEKVLVVTKDGQERISTIERLDHENLSIRLSSGEREEVDLHAIQRVVPAI